MTTMTVPATVRDTAIVMARELRPLLANPFSLLFGMVQPLVFLALFGPLLRASIGPGVWLWFVPSVLVMIVLFGSSTTGANLGVELQTGAHERMLVTPLSRPSLLIGRSLKEMAPIGGQAVVIVLVMLPFGFRFNLGGGLLGVLLLAVFGVGLGSLSYALALAVRKNDWMFWVVQQALLYPLMILSGMLLPLDGGPGWMRVLAHVNPLAYVVDAERSLFAGQFTSSVGWGWLAAAVTATVGLSVGIRTMVRSAA